MSATDRRLDELCINTIRTLAMDAVQAANSGHPGTPMAMAPVAYTLWQRFLRYDPDDPLWPNRDRFVLSMGHASMLLYALLHLAGVKAVRGMERLGTPALTLDDLKHFRQLGSKTPGHPEYGMTSGVETTTGPLGQGAGNSVGMAIAARFLGARYNRPGFALFDYRTYALCSDGDLMEGVGGEAASLAGHLRLGNLCWIYDANGITLDARADVTFTEDVGTRFRGYGWQVLEVADANEVGAVEQALAAAGAAAGKVADRPSLVIVHSHIAYGAPHLHDTAKAHGSPLGEEEVRGAKRFYGWPEDRTFYVPDGVREWFDAGVGQRGRLLRSAWMARVEEYGARYPDLADQLVRMQRRELPAGWDRGLPGPFAPSDQGVATRETAGETLNALAKNIPWLVGGSADLDSSTRTHLDFAEAGEQQPDNPGGRNIHYGVREHAMGAVTNGLSVADLRPFAATFLIFSDYMRPPIRLAALMEQPTLYVFTHDSIGLGEDGPTHQPVEQLASLRAMPGMVVYRPADANEVVVALRTIMQLHRRPACLVLSRQKLPILDRGRYAAAGGAARGAYVLADAEGGPPEVILMATGSEVALCVRAFEELKGEGLRARVVSMPSWEIFDEQPEAYRRAVLPPQVTARVAVEQAASFGWDRYLGPHGEMIGMHTFGASAPVKELLRKFGFTPDRVAQAAREQLGRKRPGA
ncbi:MAG TPA: transketolase [Polyangia bacterium]|jgi:transketolase